HHAKVERDPIEPAGAGVHRVGVTGLLVGRLETVGIMLETERILRAKVPIELPPTSIVGQELDILLRRKPAVVAALGADIERAFKLFSEIYVAAGVAFFPGIGRNLQALPGGLPRLLLLPKPRHASHGPVGGLGEVS